MYRNATAELCSSIPTCGLGTVAFVTVPERPVRADPTPEYVRRVSADQASTVLLVVKALPP
jgi:hypothetical protein